MWRVLKIGSSPPTEQNYGPVYAGGAAVSITASLTGSMLQNGTGGIIQSQSQIRQLSDGFNLNVSKTRATRTTP